MNKYFLKFLESKNVSKQDFEGFDQLKQMELYIEFQDKAMELIEEKASSSVVTELKESINTIKETIEKGDAEGKITALKDSIEEISEAVEKLRGGNSNPTSVSIRKAFVDSYAKVLKEIQKRDKPVEFAIKADVAFNLVVTAAGGEFPADEANVDTNLLFQTAIDTGLAEDLRREHSILMEIRNPIPLRIGEAVKWYEKHSESGDALSVTELKAKPKATFKLKLEKKEAGKIAVTWIMSEEFINRMDVMTAVFMEHFTKLLTETLEEDVFGSTAGVLSYSAPYAHDAALVFPDANKFDALNAVTASMRDANYKPSHLVINEIDLATMFGDKGSDGHYNLANGGSIRLIENGTQLIVGANTLRIVKVNSEILAAGTFTIVDWSKIKFGMGVSPIMRANPFKYFEENAIEYVLETPFVAAIPATYPYAVVEDTFDNVISQIDEPAV